MGRGKEYKYIKGGDKIDSKQSMKKVQGEPAKSKSASETYIKRPPRSQGRGMGSAFANGVSNIIDQSKHIKGSDTGFLGKEKKVLDPSKQVNRDLMYKGKGEKLRQGDD